jgi:hypothetical protein
MSGYGFSIWTVERLSAHLDKVTGTALSESRLRALLKRKGYRYRRPKYDLGHLQDKQAKSKAADLLDELKKGHRRRFRSHLYLQKSIFYLAQGGVPAAVPEGCFAKDCGGSAYVRGLIMESKKDEA